MSPSFRLAVAVLIAATFSNSGQALTPPSPVVPIKSAGTFESEKLGVRWLADLDSPRVRQWVSDHNQKTRNWLALTADGQPDPFYASLAARYKELAPSNPAPYIETPSGKVLTKAGGLVLVDLAGVEVALAPKIQHADGSGVSVVAEYKVSPDSSKVLYSYVKNGSDVNTWSVVDLASRKVVAGPLVVRLNDTGWASDSQAIYFTDWDNAEDLAKNIRRTRNFRVDLSTGQQELIFQPPQKDSREFYNIDDLEYQGQRYFIAHRIQGVAEVPVAVYLGRKAVAGKGEFQVGQYAWKTVRHPLTHRLGKYIAAYGSKIILRSSEAGDGFGLVAVDFAKQFRTSTLVSARPNQVLIVAQRVNNNLLLQFFNKQDFTWSIEVADLDGKIVKSFKLSDVGLPDVGAVGGFVAGKFSKSAFLVYNEFRVPPTTLKIDLDSLKLERLPNAAPAPLDASRIRYSMEWVTSQDGTPVPITVFTRTDLPKPKFGYLFYYGYIGIPQFSWWNRKIQMALEMGAAVVMVHHRGGGEQGVQWQMSVKVDRMPSLEDSVAAGRWMRKNLGVDKIVVTGRSFGGMHSMELLTHYAQEFDAFVPVVGVSDVNEFLSAGPFGFYAVDDFGLPRDKKGNPLDTPEWRQALAKWSPLANLNRLTQLKPTLIFAADHDERTGPEQSYYMVEALNQKFPGNQLVYFYEEKNNGHNARSEFVDESAFLGRVFGIQQLLPLK
ncbi:MAG: S9 family peptidase [Bdellovibrionales bacterium]|nr:S9 family peptidase [Bdellovibrionales bacterium]